MCIQIDETRAQRHLLLALFGYGRILGKFDEALESLDEVVTEMEGNGGFEGILPEVVNNGE
ncbi:MAG: hypothetical protein A2Y38_04140 [Spirochaetes bacterium GWB1_59_5]|nr:MAG: hypothetical protein A2Y38_04140 [Spirochaetes bacterium GWB1_59_5]